MRASRMMLVMVVLMLVLAAIPTAAQPPDRVGVYFINYTPETVTLAADNVPVLADVLDYNTDHVAVAGGASLVINDADGIGLSKTVTLDPASDWYYVVLYPLNGSLELSAFSPETVGGLDVNYALQSPWIYLNLLTTSDGIDVMYDGETVISGLGYGEVGVALAPFDVFERDIVDSDTGESIVLSPGNFGEPYYTAMLILQTDDENPDGDPFFDGYDMVVTDLVTYLNAYHQYAFTPSFETFVNLAVRGGLDGELSGMSEWNILLASDDAFSQLPSADLIGINQSDETAANAVAAQLYKYGQDGGTLETAAGTTLALGVNDDGFDTINNVLVLRRMPLWGNGAFNTAVFMDGVVLPDDR